MQSERQASDILCDKKPGNVEGDSPQSVDGEQTDSTENRHCDGDDHEDMHRDGGWGWMVVAGCFVMHILVNVTQRSYGIIYRELKQRFHGTDALVTWTGGISSTVNLVGSPFSTAIANRFTTRTVAVLGGAVLGLSRIISAFAPSQAFLVFSYGIVGGIGISLISTPALLLVSKYFNRRRTIAVGLSTVGGGVGTFCGPLLSEYLLSSHGYFAYMLIMGGILLNTCVSGMLYRPFSQTLTAAACSQKAEDLDDCDTSPSKYKPEDNTSSTLKCRTVSVENKIQKTEPKCNCLDLIRFSQYLDLSLLWNLRFILFAVSMTCSCISYRCISYLLVPLANERGVIMNKAVFLISVVGITDTIGRFSSGFIFHSKFIKNNMTYAYALSIFLCGGIWFLHPFVSSYVHFAILSAIYGFFYGIHISQRLVIAADFMGIEKVSSTLSLMLVFQGTGLLIGPYIAGYLRDITGNFDASFTFISCLATVGSALLLINNTVIKRLSAEKQGMCSLSRKL